MPVARPASSRPLSRSRRNAAQRAASPAGTRYKAAPRVEGSPSHAGEGSPPKELCDVLSALEGGSLGRPLSPLEIHCAFDQMDTNQDGVISQAEFVAAYQLAGSSPGVAPTVHSSPGVAFTSHRMPSPGPSPGLPPRRDRGSSQGNFQSRLEQTLNKVSVPGGHREPTTSRGRVRASANARRRRTPRTSSEPSPKSSLSDARGGQVARAICDIIGLDAILSRSHLASYLRGTPYEDFSAWLTSGHNFEQFCPEGSGMGPADIRAAVQSYLDTFLDKGQSSDPGIGMQSGLEVPARRVWR